jgi:hypothetical protein
MVSVFYTVGERPREAEKQQAEKKEEIIPRRIPGRME